jgi:hypothetical protein
VLDFVCFRVALYLFTKKKEKEQPFTHIEIVAFQTKRLVWKRNLQRNFNDKKEKKWCFITLLFMIDPFYFNTFL